MPNNTLAKLLVIVSFAALAACHDNDSLSVDEGSGGTLASGLQTLDSSGVEREFFLILPDDPIEGLTASAVGDPPLLFTFHGYTGSLNNWVGENRVYDFIDVVGDEAVIVVPNGLPDGSGDRVWGGTEDLDFFLDIIAYLDAAGVAYDPNRIFVAGHSNGAGFTHEIGCTFGDIVRGIVTAAGGLVNNDCLGSTAVFMMQGSNDPLTNGNIAAGARNYWALYNGWETDVFETTADGLCVDHTIADRTANLPYPVFWCSHEQGHDWPDFGSEAAWAFLSSLPNAAPTPDEPAGGGVDRAKPPSDTSLFVQIEVPVDAPRPLAAAISLRNPSFVDNPTCSSPDVILNGRASVDGILVPGEVSDPVEFPITYFTFGGTVEFPSEWALSITIYVEGGSSSVIPTPGIDYDVTVPLAVIDRNTVINIPEVLTLVPVQDLCGFGS